MSHLRCSLPSHALTYSYLVDTHAGHERRGPMSHLPVGICCRERQITSVLYHPTIDPGFSQPVSKTGAICAFGFSPPTEPPPCVTRRWCFFCLFIFFIFFLFCPPLTTVTVSQRFQARINIIDLGCIALHLHSRFLEPIGGWGWNKSLTKSDQGNRRSTSYLPGRQHGLSWEIIITAPPNPKSYVSCVHAYLFPRWVCGDRQRPVDFFFPRKKNKNRTKSVE